MLDLDMMLILFDEKNVSKVLLRWRAPFPNQGPPLFVRRATCRHGGLKPG